MVQILTVKFHKWLLVDGSKNSWEIYLCSNLINLGIRLILNKPPHFLFFHQSSLSPLFCHSLDFCLGFSQWTTCFLHIRVIYQIFRWSPWRLSFGAYWYIEGAVFINSTLEGRLEAHIFSGITETSSYVVSNYLQSPFKSFIRMSWWGILRQDANYFEYFIWKFAICVLSFFWYLKSVISAIHCKLPV